MFERWHAYAGFPTRGSVLDVGATPDHERADSNCMIPWFHDKGLDVVLYSPEDISGLASAYPFARIIPSLGFGHPPPIKPASYDWVAASAVLEHVGPADAQADFLADCARLAKGLFITTPNRFHWLEFHTKLPLLHWLPRSLHRALLKGLRLGAWADERHLRLVGKAELAALAARSLGRDFSFQIETVQALGMTSNLVLLARRSPPWPPSAPTA
jgi:hypothetical protein